MTMALPADYDGFLILGLRHSPVGSYKTRCSFAPRIFCMAATTAGVERLWMTLIDPRLQFERV